MRDQITDFPKNRLFFRWIHMYTGEKPCDNATLLPGFSLMIARASLCGNRREKPRSPDRDQHRHKKQHQPDWPELPGKKRQKEQIAQHAERDLGLDARGLAVKPRLDRGEILARPEP